MMKIGPYEVQLTRRSNCRRMTLRYSAIRGTFALSIPRSARLADAEAFARSRLSWMTQVAGSSGTWQAQYAPGERHMLLGRRMTLGVDVPAGDAYLKLRNETFREVLEALLEKWTAKMGVTVNQVVIRDMKSRWGSCKAKERRLCFNVNLAVYPPELIELTVVHELCHYFHQDHSAAFYREMDRWLPDWQQRRAMRQAMEVRPEAKKDE